MNFFLIIFPFFMATHCFNRKAAKLKDVGVDIRNTEESEVPKNRINSFSLVHNCATLWYNWNCDRYQDHIKTHTQCKARIIKMRVGNTILLRSSRN